MNCADLKEALEKLLKLEGEREKEREFPLPVLFPGKAVMPSPIHARRGLKVGLSESKPDILEHDIYQHTPSVSLLSSPNPNPDLGDEEETASLQERERGTLRGTLSLDESLSVSLAQSFLTSFEDPDGKCDVDSSFSVCTSHDDDDPQP